MLNIRIEIWKQSVTSWGTNIYLVIDVVLVPLLLTLNLFTPSSVFIVDFEQINVNSAGCWMLSWMHSKLMTSCWCLNRSYWVINCLVEEAVAQTELDKFTSTCPIFWACDFICAPDRTRKKKTKSGRTKSNSMGMSDRKKLETIIFVLCDLHRACSFHFYCNSIKKFLQWDFCSVNAVWMSKIRCASKNNFLSSDASI